MSSGSEQVEQVEQCEVEVETQVMTEHLYRRRLSELRAQQQHDAHREHSAESAHPANQVVHTVTERMDGMQRGWMEQHSCRPDTKVPMRECHLGLGSRVTRFSHGGVAEHGVVRWIGWLRGCANYASDTILAGVQFVLLFTTLFFCPSSLD